MDYATTAQIGDFAQEFQALGPSGQTLIATSASRLFDRLCEVEDNFFAASSGESDRVVFGDGTAYLKIPPYTTLGTDPIVILDDDDNEMEIPDYFEGNGYLVIKGYGQGIPTRDVGSDIFGSTWSSWSGWTSWNPTTFTGWPVNKEITVSAAWGFATIPSDVTQATIQLAIHLWRTGDPAFTAISQSGQPYAPPAVPAQVAEIAKRYREKYSTFAIFG